jgi:chitinase
MTNDGRADIVSVDPHTGGLTLWENSCPAPLSSEPSKPDPTIPDDPDDTETLECDPSDPEPGCVIGYPIGPCWDGHNYHTIDDVENGRADIPDHCVNTYLLNALSETMSAALEKFDDIMANNYEKRFNAFASMVRGQTGNSWDKIWTSSDTYWNCYAMVSGEKKSQKCLQTFHMAELWEPKDGICDMLNDDYQFDCSLIYYPETTISEPDFCNPRTGFCTRRKNIVWHPTYDYELDLPDPADSIAKSLEMYRDYSDWLSSVSASTQIGQFEESEGDVVDASVITVLSVQAAADAMETVSEEGEDAIEEKKKRTIVAFVTAFLLLIPGVGQTAGAGLAVARLGRLAAVVDVAGNSALGIYSIVEDPGNAPGEVVAMIFGVLGSRSNFGWGKAAHKARRIDDVVFDKLGDAVSVGVKKTRKLANQCGEA